MLFRNPILIKLCLEKTGANASEKCIDKMLGCPYLPGQILLSTFWASKHSLVKLIRKDHVFTNPGYCKKIIPGRIRHNRQKISFFNIQKKPAQEKKDLLLATVQSVNSPEQFAYFYCICHGILFYFFQPIFRAMIRLPKLTDTPSLLILLQIEKNTSFIDKQLALLFFHPLEKNHTCPPQLLNNCQPTRYE